MFLQSRYQYDGAWRSSLTQDFMDLLKRPVGTIYFILYSKLELHLFTMTGNSGQQSCGISYQTLIKGSAAWDFENHFVFLLLLPCSHSADECALHDSYLTRGWAEILFLVSVHFLVTFCAVAHVYVARAFSTCWLKRAPLQVSFAKSIYEPKSKLPLSFLGVSIPHPPRRLVLLAQHWHNEEVYFCIYCLAKVIFWVTHWAETWGTKTDSS